MGCNKCLHSDECSPHEKQLMCGKSYRLKRGKLNIWWEMSYRRKFSNWKFQQSDWDEYLEKSDVLLIIDMLEV